MRPITRWHFIRHAPVLGAQGLTHNSPDEPADLSGRAALAALAARLPEGALWLVSPLRRAQETADALLAEGARVGRRLIEPGLREQHYGDCYGLEWPALEARMQHWTRHNFWFMAAAVRPEGGESFLDVLARVEPVLAQHNNRPPADGEGVRDIVAISHGGAIRAALALALEIDPDRALSVSIETLSLTRLDHMPGPDRGGDWRLLCLNSR